jgi:uncharacterized protein with HEPN domain
MAIKAVSMNLVLIGENVKRVPVEIKQKYRQIPWVKMKLARNFIAHEYPKVEFKEMWDTANFELPPIREMLQKILEEEYTKKEMEKSAALKIIGYFGPSNISSMS